MEEIVIGGIYKHYRRGGEYEVIGFARHSETLEELVVYKPLYDSPEFPEGTLWVRPREMFLEDVEVDGEMVKRFQYQERKTS
ncbi:MAG: DUF1653 domain-containing protein [Candidatus Magasanikbacteria bacterium CG_4_9_14_0_2_um_filter_41_10]|uniref:DUF1653 domain-containing protein n=1 Tax=Candidatus Magasanikbacteria bacterium CG_4_10_14_0_2_um_filter_41_31 TaxID=1974639 RepID=A0A2M7V4Z6_9BACT|nr:MAG: hypothetical protein AUJ37_04500 [Candidatus Magasanikbacteria bacterium CG1_02_41_34]PIZ93562.1 MAG: DUF1653 domain-containing protein [Candidatus Magasanikbacteria bacterium CG_4_10_14_0_2_um_filter_41_31]PJC53310.1 MAG: DUF1653 domain-containing protein [Candidatus Magasanikbacteria bacterium CG_4_9_14_0_2_um_filter_41_10]